MSKPQPPAEEMVLTWTTWEELLLTCAVKRHGLKDWESVAMELQNRSSTPLVLTAQICRNKYNDLKRRFIDENGSAPSAGDGHGDSIPWLEELRKLRVAELKQEVHRHDLSIQSLQLKVKRLEEEREKNSTENEKNDNETPDLKNESLDAGKTAGTAPPVPENVTGKSVSGEYSDRDSRTLNESNSAGNRDKTGDEEPEPVQTGPVQRDPEPKPIGEDSCNDSSDTVAKIAASKPSLEKRTESNELRNNSGAESKERITINKESSDVQSSASLTKKIRRRGMVVGGGEEKDGGGGGGATVKREVVKSEPLVGFLDIFRSHKHGSIFERRLDIQKTDKYKNTVRQHVDLETIQTRIEDGSYSSCPTKFYSDLLLLFNNATVFFPKDSDESAAAIELRSLVLKEIKKKEIGRHSPEPAKTQPKPDPEKHNPESSDPLLSKHKTSVPIVVCRKRSSITTKPGSSSKPPEEKSVTKPKPDSKTDLKPVSKNANEDDSSSIKLKGKEKPVTGVRSMRRSSNNNSNSNRIVNTTTSSKGQGSNLGALGKAETGPKGEKKKEVVAAVAPGKKSGAADFLKRIKRNSPAKGSAEESSGGSGRREQQKKKVVEEKKEVASVKKKGGAGGGGGGNKGKEECSPSKRNVGRPPKRGAEVVVTAKRGREVDGGGGGGEEEEGGSNTKRPKKRTRR